VSMVGHSLVKNVGWTHMGIAEREPIIGVWVEPPPEARGAPGEVRERRPGR